MYLNRFTSSLLYRNRYEYHACIASSSNRPFAINSFQEEEQRKGSVEERVKQLESLLEEKSNELTLVRAAPVSIVISGLTFSAITLNL